jgi:DNA-binding NarL/FixJ family response regulator
MGERIRVVVVDDHPLWRQGVVSTLAAQPDFEIVAEGESAAEAVSLVGALLPDVVILDVNMPGGGINAANAIDETYPVVKIVMLTVSEDVDVVMEAFKAHARGYVLKGVSSVELVRIVRAVCAGESYITPPFAVGLLTDFRERTERRTADEFGPLGELTKREGEILERLSEGLSNKQIAAELHLSEKTVKHYMTNILKKLRVHNRVEAALLAQKEKLL